MSPIIDHLQSVLPGYGLNSLHVAGKPIDVRSQNCLGIFRNSRFDLRRINAKTFRVDVYKNRLTALPKQRIGCSNIRKWSGDHLFGYLKGFQRHLEYDGAVAAI